MLPDRALNPGPLTYESGALPIALRGPAYISKVPEGNEWKCRAHDSQPYRKYSCFGVACPQIDQS